LLYAIDQSDKSILSNETTISYSAQTEVEDKSGGHGYERSANGRRGGIDLDYKYATLKSFSYDVRVDQGSIHSDWFWLHVIAKNPYAESGTTEDMTSRHYENHSEYAWQKDIEVYDWDDPDWSTPQAEYVDLVKVRLVDDRMRASAFRNRYPKTGTDDDGMIRNTKGEGYLYLVTSGGHIVPFRDYGRYLKEKNILENFHIDEINPMTDSATPFYGYHFGLVDYKTGKVKNIRPIPIFAFDNDLKFTIYTNEQKALVRNRSVRGSIVLDQTKAKESDRDVLNVHVDLFGDNRDVVPETNTVLNLDASTLTTDIEIIDKPKATQ
jgi:hypothetical protein